MSHSKKSSTQKAVAVDFQIVGARSIDSLTFSDTLPAVSQIQIMPANETYHHWMGDITFSSDFIAKICENFGKRRTDMVVDYNHGSLAENGPETSKAAGWVKALVDKGASGLWATVEWTAEAAGYIKEKQYRYISPEFSTDYFDKLTGDYVGPALLAVALTNRPFLDMAPVELAAKADKAPEFVFAFKELEKPKKEKAMLKKVIEVLKLKDEATEDEVLKVVESREVALKDAEAKIATLTDEKAKAEASVSELQGKVNGLEEEKRVARANAAVEKLVKEGKLYPVKKDWAISLFLKDEESFNEFAKDLPVVVKINAPEGTGSAAEEGSPEKALLSLADQIQRERKVNFNQALEAIRTEKPEVFAAWQTMKKTEKSAH